MPILTCFLHILCRTRQSNHCFVIYPWYSWQICSVVCLAIWTVDDAHTTVKKSTQRNLIPNCEPAKWTYNLGMRTMKRTAVSKPRRLCVYTVCSEIIETRPTFNKRCDCFRINNQKLKNQLGSTHCLGWCLCSLQNLISLTIIGTFYHLSWRLWLSGSERDS